VRKIRNSFAFTDIATEEQAYWLGFLAADGSVKRHHALVVHLAGYDEDHLRRLRQFLESDHSISIGKSGSVSFTVYDRQIASDLYCFGVRTGEDRFAPELPGLERHYFRGLFDGDGYIGQSATNRLWQMTLGTDKVLCESFAEQVRIHTASKARVFFADGVWRCTVGGQEEPRKLAAWLYQGATIFLPRKYEKFLEMTGGTGLYVDRTADCLQPKELARQAGITPRAVLKHIHRGSLTATRVGSHWWIDRKDAEEWYRQFDESLAVA
jgi:excisionase family DNA binding protein